MNNSSITVSNNRAEFVSCNICLEKENLHEIEISFYNRKVYIVLCDDHLSELGSKINKHLI